MNKKERLQIKNKIRYAIDDYLAQEHSSSVSYHEMARQIIPDNELSIYDEKDVRQTHYAVLESGEKIPYSAQLNKYMNEAMDWATEGEGEPKEIPTMDMLERMNRESIKS